MKKSLLRLFFLFTAFVSLHAQDLRAYSIFDKRGHRVSFQKMITKLQQQHLIFFGEHHDNPIAHWLQLELAFKLSAQRKLILGAEMIEADNQDALNAYLKDSITQKGLDTLARLWNNYHTDYKPLIDFAKRKQIPFIATNIPRKYARLVHKKGLESLDSLTEQEKKWMAPLPIVFDPGLPMYKQMQEMMGDHASPNIVKAQAIKDATMAHFILKNYVQGHLFLHFNGAYHSDFHEGIVWYVQREHPAIECATISTVSQKNVEKLEKENMGRADFIIVVDEDMTRTF